MTREPGVGPQIKIILMHQIYFLSQIDLRTAAEYLGYTSAIIMAIAAIAGIFWYVFQQKDDEHVERSVQSWRELAEAQGAKIEYLTKELAEVRLELVNLERKLEHAEQYAEDLRKANLRLQGIQEH